MSLRFIDSPIGIIALQEQDAKITRVAFVFGRRPSSNEPTPRALDGRQNEPLEAFTAKELQELAAVRYQDVLQTTKTLERLEEELGEYFSGVRRAFDLPLQPEGTPFRLKVWNALVDVPYGQTETYGGLAKKICMPNASRAVGLAMQNNPIGIIQPCHRIVGANGKLTGFNGGLDRKAFLLKLEGVLK